MRKFSHAIRHLFRIGLLAVLSSLLLVACSANATPSSSNTQSATNQLEQVNFSLLEVPFTISIPASDASLITAAPVKGDWITQMSPLAATQISYKGEDGSSNFLANAFWFDTAQLNKILNPNEPPPGQNMAVVGDRTLVVAVTVEMPFADGSADAETYGRLSEIFREKTSFKKFGCPETASLDSQSLSPETKAVVTAYFQGKDLLPVHFNKNEQLVVPVQEQVVGIHSCFNAGSNGEAQYSGSVPKAATAALMVYVQHKAYAETGATGSFVTLAKVGGSWSIVSEGTGP